MTKGRHKNKHTVQEFILEVPRCATDLYVTRERPFEQFLHGASAHFHQRTISFLRTQKGPPFGWVEDQPAFVELLYAVLASWGMDSQKARLRDFSEFSGAIRGLVKEEAFRAFESARLEQLNHGWVGRLQTLYRQMEGPCRVMASNSTFVGSSKVLHHLLPDVFPPMDRKYTLSFLAKLSDPEYRVLPKQSMNPDSDAFVKGMLFFGQLARSVENLDSLLTEQVMSGSIPKVLDNALMVWWRERKVGRE